MLCAVYSCIVHSAFAAVIRTRTCRSQQDTPIPKPTDRTAAMYVDLVMDAQDGYAFVLLSPGSRQRCACWLLALAGFRRECLVHSQCCYPVWSTHIEDILRQLKR
ncbi:hypothetical protein VTK26DRAFT_816 [Humicola hyalothermophila]